MPPAPIALFAFNRPDHTRRLLRSLRRNALADESDLFVFSDGPKRERDADAVREVRDLVRSAGGFRSVTVVERSRNFGLGESIIDGVTTLVGEFGCAVVLEDDLVLAPHFLSYMNDALIRFRDEPQVMHVSGYTFPVAAPHLLPESFFYRLPASWGWATWERAWRRFEPDAALLARQIRAQGRQYQFDILGTANFLRLLDLQARGRVDSWAVRWYASVFLAGGLALYPDTSLVVNAGHDGTGVHCGTSDDFEVGLRLLPVAQFPDAVLECAPAVEQMADFYRRLQRPLHRQALSAAAGAARALIGKLSSSLGPARQPR